MQVGDSFFKTVIAQMYDGVYFTDRSRRISYWNHGAGRITGYANEEGVGSFCKDHTSIGASLVNEDANWQSVLSRAGQYLYHSKKMGRNRVTMDGVQVW
jgi:PAS domain S-box-containing protein